MKFAKTFLLALGLCLVASTVVGQSAPVYKWVDENGVTHYGSQPPGDSNFQSTGIRAKRTNKQALQTRVTNQADLRDVQNVRKEHAADQASQEEARRQEDAKERAANCEKAREQLTAYDTAPRLYRPLPNGQREYLSDEEIDAERANARRQVRQWCE